MPAAFLRPSIHELDRAVPFRPLILALTMTLLRAGLQRALAAPDPLPASLYPSQSHLTANPILTNHQFDCLWGFFCEANRPVFHFQTQDELQRLSGFGQYADWRGKRHTMAFELFASRYAATQSRGDIAWSRAAMNDLHHALIAQGYAPLAAGEVLQIAMIRRIGQTNLVVMAARRGQNEVEAIVRFDRNAGLRSRALRLLQRQVEAALDILG